jgi:hypothetical protein
LTLGPQLSDTFGVPVHLLLMALHTVLPSEAPEALIALGTYGRVHGAPRPYFVLGPNVTVLVLLIPSFIPITVLFGTAFVSGSMRPASGIKLSNTGRWSGEENNSPHLVGVGFLMIATFPCTPYAGSRSFSGQRKSWVDRRNHICRFFTLTTVIRRMFRSLDGARCA